MADNLNFCAVCLFGLESLLGEELDAMGCKRTETIDGRVFFTAPAEFVARVNIRSRYAERIYIVLGSFQAETFDALFRGTRALPWEEFIGRDDRFPVTGHSVKSKLFSIPDCQSIVKKAIVERMKRFYPLSVFPETGAVSRAEFFILRDRVWLMLDTSGVPLHKRGYRPETVTAPLRETLAAALAKLARPRSDVLFWDPFCGSGTIAIEAAMLMTGRAPGLERSFAAQSGKYLSQKIWRDAFDEARSEIKPDAVFEAYASDIDPDCVRIARESAARAGVDKYVKAFSMDALTIETGGRRGTIVCNPPYGERLLDLERCEQLYRDMGQNWTRLGKWQIYVLCSHEGFERLYGRRADKVRKLYNGMIKCFYYQFFKNKD